MYIVIKYELRVIGAAKQIKLCSWGCAILKLSATSNRTPLSVSLCKEVVLDLPLLTS
jgi:hypothetical protein